MSNLPEMLGAVEWFSNQHGYGMAKGEDTVLYWLHYSEFEDRKTGWRVELWKGQTLKFLADVNDQRGPRARKVIVVQSEASSS